MALQTEVLRLPTNPDYVKIRVTGRVGRIDVSGKTLGIHLGLYDEITWRESNPIAEGQIRRLEGGHLPHAANRAVLEAVLAALQEAHGT